ncbi:hypothetical protein AAEX37_01062 [Oligella sp. MSHR50489EDL]|uniref:hypothetical protein n=1 Tax=Oligella TaxID=90243 RepID=UPI000D00645D|nr:hypothetical protein [Oligella urethralis]AVL70621.1 hypothetical protein CEQ07_03765 [Oligella urethralis]
MKNLVKIMAFLSAMIFLVGCSEKDTLAKARENLNQSIDKFFECALPIAKQGGDWKQSCDKEKEAFNQANTHFKNNYTLEHKADKELLDQEFIKIKKDYNACKLNAWGKKTDGTECESIEKDPKKEFEYIIRFEM